MNKVVIEAMNRTEKPRKVRREGLIPGVLNGPSTASVPVQFNAAELKKLLVKYGQSVKLWIKIGAEEKFGFIKEIQRDPVSEKIIHIAIQLVAVDQDIKLHLPIIYEGRDVLKREFLQLQIEKSELGVEGRAEFMPSSILLDVSKKKQGENILAKDFDLPSQIKLTDREDEVFASIKGKNNSMTQDAEPAAAV